MEGSRVRILNLLLQRKQATVEQLSREMGLASATVRRHLDILQRDNLVAYQQVKKRTGRPEHLYSLTEEGQEYLPKGYSVLLARLVEKLSSLRQDDLAGRNGDELVRSIFRDLASEVTGATAEIASAPLEQRVRRALFVLEGEQFLPTLEEGPDGVRLHLNNCPFRSVAMGHPAVCEYDQSILKTLLGDKVVKETSIRNGAQGCCYLTPTA